MPSPSKWNTLLPESEIAATVLALLLTTPTMKPSVFRNGIGSVTATVAVPLGAIVITTLQPVPFGSAGWGNVVPVGAPGQTVPATADPVAPAIRNNVHAKRFMK